MPKHVAFQPCSIVQHLGSKSEKKTPIPISFETDTFIDTKFFWDRYQYFPDTNIFQIRFDQNKWKSFETEKFWNRNVTLCWHYHQYHQLPVPLPQQEPPVLRVLASHCWIERRIEKYNNVPPFFSNCSFLPPSFCLFCSTVQSALLLVWHGLCPNDIRSLCRPWITITDINIVIITIIFIKKT